MRIDSEQRARRLRALERLRSGLPPDGAAELISVGTEGLIAHFERFCDGRGNGGRGTAVLGTYGAGKSHALSLIRDIAYAKRIATCWLSADASESALNHPQRFLCGLLQTFEAPAQNGGYAELLTRILEDVTSTLELADVIDDCFCTGASIDVEVRRLARMCVSYHQQGLEGDEVIGARDNLVRLLSGETLVRAPGANNYRAAAYRVLELASRAARIGGYEGLLVVVDEVESVFTKLHSRMSRNGAFRVLAALLYGLDAPHMKVALAMTPDAWQSLVEELGSSAKWMPANRIEPVVRLERELSHLVGYRCEALSTRDVVRVLESVKDLYAAVHTETYIHATAWKATLEQITETRPPVRLAIRAAVDHLDRERCQRSVSSPVR